MGAKRGQSNFRGFIKLVIERLEVVIVGIPFIEVTWCWKLSRWTMEINWFELVKKGKFSQKNFLDRATSWLWSERDHAQAFCRCVGRHEKRNHLTTFTILNFHWLTLSSGLEETIFPLFWWIKFPIRKKSLFRNWSLEKAWGEIIWHIVVREIVWWDCKKKLRCNTILVWLLPKDNFCCNCVRNTL